MIIIFRFLLEICPISQVIWMPARCHTVPPFGAEEPFMHLYYKVPLFSHKLIVYREFEAK